MNAQDAVKKALKTAQTEPVLITFDYRLVTGQERIEKMVRDYPEMCIGVYNAAATPEMIAEDLR